MVSFSITSEPIEDRIRIDDDQAGGFVVFEGRVRNHNEDKPVLALEYEAFAELAEKEGRQILAEAVERFAVCDVWAAHRVGKLAIGDVAVRVEVAASHRQAAFAACRFLIDEIKRRVPIWKKEHYADGPSEWLNCDAGSIPLTEQTYYSRQTSIHGFSDDAQKRLAESHVVVVGAGGLGCAVLPYLAAAGVGRISIIDEDCVEASNLHRQVLFGSGDLGSPKSDLAAERLRSQNPFINVTPIRERLGPRNAESLLRAASLVVDCTDNFYSKFLINDACVKFGVPLVQASIYQMEGQIHTYDPTDPDSACLRCMWPETPAEGCVGTCAEVGVFGFVAGVLGSMQAAEAVKNLAGFGMSLSRELVLVDLATMETTRVKRYRDPGCPTCHAGAKVRLEPLPEWEVHTTTGFTIVDIREPEEVLTEPFPMDNVVLMPTSEFDIHDSSLAEGPILLVCRSGRRSAKLAQELRRLGRADVFSLVGGVEGTKRIDANG